MRRNQCGSPLVTVSLYSIIIENLKLVYARTPSLIQVYYLAFQCNRCPKRFERSVNSGQSCPRVGWTRGSGRVGSGRVGSRFWRILAGRVSTSDFFSFSLIISWYLNRYESSNTTFGLIDFLRYLLYNN